jgi:TorA maturation chaperone TorD
MTDPRFLLESARADAARLLAACYYEPMPAFEEEGVFEALSTAARTLDPALGAEAEGLAADFAAEPLDELLRDYTRLFLGPTETLAPPYGSVWLSGPRALMDDTTLAVQALYAEAGYELAEDFRELPDHVAAELELLYLLSFRVAQALASGRDEGQAQAAASRALRRRLLGEHLSRWLPPFAAAVEGGADTAFYRRVGRLTARLAALPVD